MKLKSAKLTNFRKHESSKITFEDDVTVVVGENDTGKSSLINAIQIGLRNEKIDIADFLDKSLPIEIELELDDKIYAVKAEITDDKVIQRRVIYILSRIAASIRSNLDSYSDGDLREMARLFGVRVK